MYLSDPIRRPDSRRKAMPGFLRVGVERHSWLSTCSDSPSCRSWATAVTKMAAVLFDLPFSAGGQRRRRAPPFILRASWSDERPLPAAQLKIFKILLYLPANFFVFVSPLSDLEGSGSIGSSEVHLIDNILQPRCSSSSPSRPCSILTFSTSVRSHGTSRSA